MTLKTILRAGWLVLWLASYSAAQNIGAPPPVPISKEAHHHLVLENDYVRVYSVEVPPHSETLVHQHDLDYVFVTLGDSDVENVRVGEKPVRLQLKDGEVRFTKGGFAHKAVNKGDKPFRNVTVELKRRQDSTLSSYAVAISSAGMVSINGAPKSGQGVHGEVFFLDPGADISPYEAQAYPKGLGANSNRLIVTVTDQLTEYPIQGGSRRALKKGATIWKKATQETRIKNEGITAGKLIVLSFM